MAKGIKSVPTNPLKREFGGMDEAMAANTQVSLTEIANLADRSWRLNNIYSYKNKDAAICQFKPNWCQKLVFDSLTYRNVDLKGRQIGMTTGYCILWVDWCMFNKNISVGIVAHTKDDARIIFRDKVKFVYDNLPPQIKAAMPLVKSDAHELIFANGSSIRVAVTFRSGTVQILHVTELGYICRTQPQRAEEIKSGAMEAVPKDGIIVVESTAEGGTGDFFNLCQEAMKGNNWRFTFLPWYNEPSYTYDEPVTEAAVGETDYLDLLEAQIKRKLSRGQRSWWIIKRRGLGDKVFSQYPSTVEEAFKASNEGAYYAKQMLAAWTSGRITNVPIQPGTPVETWWDIGVGDSNTIWFVQREGLQIRVVDCYSNSGEGFPFYARYCREWEAKWNVRFGRHIGPHDFRNRDYGSGESRVVVASKLGFNFEVAPALTVDAGIDAVRAMLPMCLFDEGRCGPGIKALEAYRKKWNQALGVWHDYPLHDWASHFADGFRMGAVTGGKGYHLTSGTMRSPAREIVSAYQMQ